MKSKKFRWWALVSNSIKLKTKELEYQDNLKKEKDKHEREINSLTNRIERINELFLTKLGEMTKLQETLEQKDKKIKQQGIDNGKLKKIITKLENQVVSLGKQLEESMTDKYLVRKIPSGKTPKGATMKTTRRQAPQVQKYLKEVEKTNE